MEISQDNGLINMNLKSIKTTLKNINTNKMETTIQIETPKKEKDYFPSLFTNKDKTIIIFADSRTSEKTFSGIVIHSANLGKNSALGTYSTGWTYVQFSRLPKGIKLSLTILQED